ncbi:hypothetical protein CBOM_02892 [Ceraceosorus bombacis]|uniref:Uncharacterized protein n=1 Tax=Ceraceosorus bombacis TaxID=401625 RepID=A0A0P1BH43_9BASI|nr:hypothetical protein CBOM_02892 [Ceraceosorus bombacis]
MSSPRKRVKEEPSSDKDGTQAPSTPSKVAKAPSRSGGTSAPGTPSRSKIDAGLSAVWSVEELKIRKELSQVEDEMKADASSSSKK